LKLLYENHIIIAGDWDTY